MTIAEKLVEAEAALHDLMTGRTVVEVTDQNGERVKYNQASKRDLLTYISDLKSLLNPVANGTGPMRFWF